MAYKTGSRAKKSKNVTGELVMKVVSDVTGYEPAILGACWNGLRQPVELRDARWLLWHLLRRCAGYTQKEIAHVFGYHQAAVHYALLRIRRFGRDGDSLYNERFQAWLNEALGILRVYMRKGDNSANAIKARETKARKDALRKKFGDSIFRMSPAKFARLLGEAEEQGEDQPID